MSTLAESYADLSTTRGPMRVHLFIPEGGARYPVLERIDGHDVLADILKPHAGK